VAAALLREMEPEAACRAVARAINTTMASHSQWAVWREAAGSMAETLGDGLALWHVKLARADRDAGAAVDELANALSARGGWGREAAERFAQSLGRWPVELRENAAGERARNLMSLSELTLEQARARWTARLVEGLREPVGPQTKEALRPWAAEWLLAVSRAHKASWLVSHRAREAMDAANACERLGFATREELRQTGERLGESLSVEPAKERRLWRETLRLPEAMKSGWGAVELTLAAARAMGLPPNAGEWASAFGSGPESAQRAARAIELGLLDEKAMAGILRLRSLSGPARAAMESHGLRSALGDNGEAKPARRPSLRV
jgi:hypothetical protein